MSAATKRLLIGVMSVLQERDRRDAFRDTWLPEMAPAVATTRFVLGRTNASEADAEQAEQGDLVVLSCEENQHRGKTLLWFAHALRLPEDYAFVAKMDQDVLLWPAKLALEMASWPSSGFYGGWPVDVYRQHWQNDSAPSELVSYKAADSTPGYRGHKPTEGLQSFGVSYWADGGIADYTA